MAKKQKETLLGEDFLSDIQQKPATAAEIAGAPEATAAEEDDFADLIGGETQKTETQEPKADDGLADKIASLTDIVTGLATSVQKLNDTVGKMQQTAAPAPEAAPAEPAPEAAPAEPAPEAAPAPEGGSESAPPNIDLDLDNAASQGTDEQPPAEGGEQAPAPAQNGEQAPAQEANTEDKPNESAEENYDDLMSLDESKAGDEQMSELYRANRKAGCKLNSNSGTVIGIFESGKLYKLDGFLQTIVHGKIREKIEAAKADLKAEFLKESAAMGEMPKEEPIVEKKEESEKKSPEDRMGLLDMIKKAKAANNSYTKLDDGTECKEGQCDKKSDDKKDDKDSKKDDDKKSEKDEKDSKKED